MEIEFDENSLRGVLDQYHWYPIAMKREYGPRRKWNGDKTMLPRMNDVRRRWSHHLTNEFDRTTNIFLLLKTIYSPSREQSTIEEKWYKHLTNNVATRHWGKNDTQLAPSSHINCEMTDDQRRFLNPTMRDVILSSLEQDSFGENAKKKRARRRMCFIDGNAKSYSKWLNSDTRMEKYADHNELTGLVAELVLEKDEENERKEGC